METTVLGIRAEGSVDSARVYGLKRRLRCAFEYLLAVAAALACSYWILGGHL